MAARKFLEEAIATGEQYRTALDSIDKTLEDLLGRVHGHNIGINASRIGGGGLTVAGGALLIAAPFTLGATLVPGIMATAAGGVTTVGTAIGDYFASGEFVEILQTKQNEMLEARERFGRSLLTYMQRQAIESGIKPEVVLGMSLAILSNIVGVGNAVFNAWFNASHTIVRTLVVDTGVGAVEIAPAAAGTAVSAARTSVTIAGEGASTAGSSTGAAASAGMSTGAKVFGVAGGVVGVAAGGFDIYSGISGLVNGHPTEEGVKGLRTSIEQERSRLSEELERLRVRRKN